MTFVCDTVPIVFFAWFLLGHLSTDVESSLSLGNIVALLNEYVKTERTSVNSLVRKLMDTASVSLVKQAIICMWMNRKEPVAVDR